MGNSVPADAYICKYNKESFNEKLDIIRDAHSVSQYYAALLLVQKVPITLDFYKNYSEKTEDYFNTTRKNTLDDLGSSYYEFYQYLQTLKSVYEQGDNTETSKREILTNVFNKCYIVQKYIIEDLWEDCNNQTAYRIEPKSKNP